VVVVIVPTGVCDLGAVAIKVILVGSNRGDGGGGAKGAGNFCDATIVIIFVACDSAQGVYTLKELTCEVVGIGGAAGDDFGIIGVDVSTHGGEESPFFVVSKACDSAIGVSDFMGFIAAAAIATGAILIIGIEGDAVEGVLGAGTAIEGVVFVEPETRRGVRIAGIDDAGGEVTVIVVGIEGGGGEIVGGVL